MSKTKKELVFKKKNYQIMLLGLAFLVIGYILLAGGSSENPEVFNPNIFNARRLIWSPIFLVIGFGMQVVAILFRSK